MWSRMATKTISGANCRKDFLTIFLEPEKMHRCSPINRYIHTQLKWNEESSWLQCSFVTSTKNVVWNFSRTKNAEITKSQINGYRRSVGVSGEEIYKFGPNAGGIDECARRCREEENLRVVSQFEYWTTPDRDGRHAMTQ